MTAQSALLFTDLVDSTRLVARLGDVRAAEFWREHDRRARDLLALHRGREIDHADGFLLLFADAADAVRYALAYHASLADLEVATRAGLHVGPITLRENTPEDVTRGAKPVEVEGLAKPVGGRVMALARGGQTLITAAARAALGDSLPAGVAIKLHGHYRFAGVEEPVEVFEAGASTGCAFQPPADADKAYRVVRIEEFWLPVREIRHNLPAQHDAFVGRTLELRNLAERFDGGARLVTVLGPAGTGKTRFLCRYGWSRLGDWSGGTHFCDLSDCRSLDGIYSAVAVALGVPLGSGDPGEQLGNAIASRGRCLVMLDNFEQVAEHAPATLGRWLKRTTEASFAVTSRERLRLAGEEVFPLEPLPIDAEALELFALRARAQRPDFVLSESNRTAVEQIVNLLDGLPLAIELAAARVRLFSPAQLVERMNNRFRLLVGLRGADGRQGALKAAIDWSWDLLAPWEQAALARCSVFEGPFTLEAAEAVLELARWPDASSALDAVQALVDKSLLRVSTTTERTGGQDGEAQLGMYRSIHEYAADKLHAEGPQEQRSAEERHARYYAGFGADEAVDALSRHGGVVRRRALALTLDNLVAACRRAARRGDGNTAVATYRATWAVLDLQGPFAVANTLGAEVLAIDGMSPRLVASALLTRALGARRAGRVEEAMAWFEQAYQLFTGLGDRRQAGRVVGHLGNCNREQGRMEAALEQLESALAISRETGDRITEGAVVRNLAVLHYAQGRMASAQNSFEQAIAIHREMGDRRAEAIALQNLSTLHGEQGRKREATAYLEQAIEMFREMGDRASEASARGNMGLERFRDGRLDEAGPYFEGAIAIHRELGDRRGEGAALGNFALVLFEQGRQAEACTHLETALAIHRELLDRRFEAIVLADLGALLGEMGEMEAALANLEQALAIHRATGDRRNQGIVLGSMADLLVRQARHREATRLIAEAEALLRGVDDRMRLVWLLCSRARAEAGIGDRGLAETTLLEADAVAAAIGAGRESEIGREITKTREGMG